MQKKYLSTIFKILSSAIILYLLFSEVSFSKDEFFIVWKNVDPGYLILVLPTVIILLALKSYRWKLLIKSEGFNYKFFQAFKAYFSSFSIGIVTPGRLGEFIKVYNLRKEVEDIDTLKAFKTAFLDRLFDLFFLSWFGLSGLLFYFNILGNLQTWVIILVSFLITFLVLLLSHIILKGIILKRARNSKFMAFADSCLNSMLTFKNVFPWVISMLAYLVFFLGIHFLFLSLEIKINLLECGFIISLIGLILLLPISIAGFGTREAGLVYLLSFYGILSETAISFSLLQFLCFFAWGGLIGLIFWSISPVSLKLIKEDSRKMLKLIKNKI